MLYGWHRDKLLTCINFFPEEIKMINFYSSYNSDDSNDNHGKSEDEEETDMLCLCNIYI